MDSPVEIVIVLVVAALLLGPGRIPVLARSLGEALHELRHASRDEPDDPSAVAASAASDPQPDRPPTPDGPADTEPGAAADRDRSEAPPPVPTGAVPEVVPPDRDG